MRDPGKNYWGVSECTEKMINVLSTKTNGRTAGKADGNACEEQIERVVRLCEARVELLS